MTEWRYSPEGLAERLEDLFSSVPLTRPTGDEDPLVDAALQVSHASHPELSAEAQARIEAQVLAAYAQHFPEPLPAEAPVAVVSPVWRWQPVMRRAAIWTAAAAVVLILLLGLVTPAVAASAPGDWLYPVKRAVERVELALAAHPAGQAATLMTHAERRVAEVATLLAWRDAPAVSGPTLEALTDLAEVASLVRANAGTEAAVPATTHNDLASRTGAALAGLTATLTDGGDNGHIPPAMSASLLNTIFTMQASGMFLDTVPEDETLPTATTTASPSATSTPSPTTTATATMTPTLTATATPSATARATASVTATEATEAGDDATILDGYDCSNPPPDHAQALGWREACEGADDPSNVIPGQEDSASPGNSGNSNAGGNGGGQGQGQGRGNN